MVDVVIKNSVLAQAAAAGMDEFVNTFVDAIKVAVGGELTVETMQQLNADQITLLGYSILREEVMDGGFIQLIYNGYGAFIYRNPFDKALRDGDWQTCTVSSIKAVNTIISITSGLNGNALTKSSWPCLRQCPSLMISTTPL